MMLPTGKDFFGSPKVKMLVRKKKDFKVFPSVMDVATMMKKKHLTD